MDLKSVRIDNDPVDLAIKHPVTGEDTDIIVKVIGIDSDDFKQVDRELTKRSLKKYSKSGKLDLSNIDFDEAENTRIKRVASLVKGWENLEEDGKKLEYNEANVTKVLKEYPFISEQIEEFCTERANFINGS